MKKRIPYKDRVLPSDSNFTIVEGVVLKQSSIVKVICKCGEKQNNNTSGYTGVSFVKRLNKYESYYTYNRTKIGCGYFDTALEASQARVSLLKQQGINYVRKGSKNEYLQTA